MKTDFPLSRADLILAMQKGFRPKWAFFRGHTPARDGSITKSCFSQWWSRHPFEIDGIHYATAEHYMMAEKARLFGDQSHLTSILVAKSPAIAKKLGRHVVGFDDTIWLEHRWRIVVRANTAKFSQHEVLRHFLLQSGERILVEASPYDRIWGIGMAADHPDAERPQSWKGINLLGFALMEVRRCISAAFGGQTGNGMSAFSHHE
ncbi:MAG: NADAR family protein [Verrucomicrobiales bacterium]